MEKLCELTELTTTQPSQPSDMATVLEMKDSTPYQLERWLAEEAEDSPWNPHSRKNVDPAPTALTRPMGIDGLLNTPTILTLKQLEKPAEDTLRIGKCKGLTMVEDQKPLNRKSSSVQDSKRYAKQLERHSSLL